MTSDRTQPPTPDTLDFVGYEVLVDFMSERSLHEIEGDIVEIGVFLGGGTAKLAEYGRRHGKRVFAIDIFDPDCDLTRNVDGTRMCDIYQAFLEGQSQRDIYRETTKGFDNIVTVDTDSREVEFPAEQRFVFGFIDGNHDPEYVRSDFHLVWNSLSPGGVVGFHDYDFDLPEVTAAVNRLVDDHRREISEVLQLEEKHIVLLTRRQG
jgi:predicted O-methyltransferase YrrM